MASKTMAITVPASLPPSSSDGSLFSAIGRLLRTLNAATASNDTSMRRSHSAIELEIAEILDGMSFGTASPHVVADTISATAVALPPAELNFAASSGNISDTEELSKAPESDESEDEFWLKAYAESHRKRPGSSAARRLEKRLLVLEQHSASRKRLAAATEESTEDILLSLSRVPRTEESIGEALPGPALPRAGPSEAAAEKPPPCENSAFDPEIAVDALAPKAIKKLDCGGEKQFHTGQKRTLPSPASAETGRDKKKNCTRKPRARKPRQGKAEEVELKGEKNGEEMVAKVEKEPYVTQSGRRVKRTAKMGEP